VVLFINNRVAIICLHKNQLAQKDFFRRLLLSNTYQLEAMIKVLERKGILTGKEVLDEMEVIVAIQEKKEVN